MKFLAVNGSPRKSMNTARLLEKAVEGAASQGAEAELVHLRDYAYTGCKSCFHCKDAKGKSYGRCILKDELAPVLQKAHEADALLLGTPVYFTMETAYMRAFMERLWYQYYPLSMTKPSLAPKKKAAALLYTMDIPEHLLNTLGKSAGIEYSKGYMERIFGPCEVFLCCDTAQFKDFSKYEHDMWDVPAKLNRRETVFPQELERAFEFGARLTGK